MFTPQKKPKTPLKGHSAFNKSTWLPSGRYLHFYEKSSYNFRVLQPFVLDAHNNKKGTNVISLY